MRRTVGTCAALLLLVAGKGEALTFFDLATGDEALLPDARSVALARTRAVESSGAFSGAANPAWLGRTQGLAVMLGGSILKLKETRSTPAYDSFDGYLVESIYVLNDEYQFEGGAAAAFGFDLGGRSFGASVSRSPMRDFQYDYTEQVRENDAFTQPRDDLLAVNEVQSDGRLDAWSIALGGAVVPDVTLGATLQLLRGEQDFVLRTRFAESGETEFVHSDVQDVEGTRVLAGATWTPRPAITAGAVFRSAADLSGDLRSESSADSTVTGAFDRKYPIEFTFGAAWRPRAKLRTTLRLETTWVQWSRYEDSLGTDLDDDVWDARLGIEHVFYNGFPVRFGIRYAPSPLDHEVATTAFTFGAGVDAGPVRADFAFEVANRRYRSQDLFDDAMFGGDTRTQKDLVEESGTSAFLTLGADWPLLGG